MKQAVRIIKEVKKAVIGKDDILVKVMEVILAGGNILIEDIPGVGKTTMALAFSKAMQLECRRVQFTPDVMPSDITGFTIYNKATGKFEYKKGAGLCNLLLADEINRTSSKTQSALLELMEEHAVTVDGVTHECPTPHIVIATQNHVGTAGALPLPESQMDRFTVRLTMGYPSLENEVTMLKDRQGVNPISRVEAVASAFLHKRDYVIPEDVKRVFIDVCAHRMIMSPQAKIAGVGAEQVLRDILSQEKEPAVV